MFKYRPFLSLASAATNTTRSLSQKSSSSQIEVTSRCVQRIKQLCEQRGKEVVLRVTVDGGGCSGFQYGFELEDWDLPPQVQTLQSEDDVLIAKDGASVIVDTLSLAYIAGSKVDYVEELISASFQVAENPNSETSCGCGVSFAPKA